MADNKGKQFEKRFKSDWERSFPNTFIYRLQDSMGGYRGISNICDFICFANNKLYLIECKKHKGNTLPWSAFSQADRLIKYKDYDNVYPGAIIWFEDHDIVIWVGIDDIKLMKDQDKKSINVKMIKDESYNIIEIPSIKQSVFLKSDYTILKNLNKRGN